VQNAFDRLSATTMSGVAEGTPLLMIGSCPPPLGGTTVLYEELLLALRQRADLRIQSIDTGALGAGGRLGAALRLGLGFGRALKDARVAALHASPPGIVRFGPRFVRGCQRAGVASIVRFFGGNLDLVYEEGTAGQRRRLDHVLASDLVLVETQALVDWLATTRPETNAIAFANHRRPPERRMPPPRTPDGTLRLVFVGHVNEQKGVADLLNALDRTHEFQVRLEVVGSTAGASTELLRALQANNKVTLRGEVPFDEVPVRIAAADALVLPTYHAGEGHPGAVLEAYAVGRPVIATRWRAVPEVVSHEETGLLVEPRDPAGLSVAIARLARDPALLARLRAGAESAALGASTAAAADRFGALVRGLG
jgi:glycosyltransferase involved in cell wall biosynthesis